MYPHTVWYAVYDEKPLGTRFVKTPFFPSTHNLKSLLWSTYFYAFFMETLFKYLIAWYLRTRKNKISLVHTLLCLYLIFENISVRLKNGVFDKSWEYLTMGQIILQIKIKPLLERSVFLRLWVLGRWYFSATIGDWGFIAVISVCSCFICSLCYVLVSVLILFCFQVSWRKTCCFDPYKVVLKKQKLFSSESVRGSFIPKSNPYRLARTLP